MRVPDLFQLYPVASLAVAGALAAAAGVAIVWLARRRLTPEELERRRRLRVQRHGRTIEGTLVDVEAPNVYYDYSVHGVEYSAAQDLSALLGLLEGDLQRLVGHVSVKYLRDNPANSIVLCEEWSGLPARSLATQSNSIEECPSRSE